MAEEQDDASKTEEPTGKRLDQAKEQGQYAMSRELNHVAMLVGTLAVVSWFLPEMVEDLAVRLTYYIAAADQIAVDSLGVQQVVERAWWDVIEVLWLPLTLLAVLGVLASGLQTGFSFTWSKLEIKFDKLNPIAGLQKYLSLGSQVLELVKSAAKVVVVGFACYVVLMPLFEKVELFAGMDLVEMLHAMQDKVYFLVTVVLVIMGLVAGADFAYNAFQHHKKLKMTKQEIKDEFKQSEGDPHIKGKLRQLRFEKSRQRMMANVPKADVVVTNPTHYAVALKYDPGAMGAPVLLAKGVDQVALKIREVAQAHKVPIVRNPPLARALYDTVEVDQEIRPEQYRAVAEVISFVFKLKGRQAKR